MKKRRRNIKDTQTRDFIHRNLISIQKDSSIYLACVHAWLNEGVYLLKNIFARVASFCDATMHLREGEVKKREQSKENRVREKCSLVCLYTGKRESWVGLLRRWCFFFTGVYFLWSSMNLLDLLRFWLLSFLFLILTCSLIFFFSTNKRMFYTCSFLWYTVWVINIFQRGILLLLTEVFIITFIDPVSNIFQKALYKCIIRSKTLLIVQ